MKEAGQRIVVNRVKTAFPHPKQFTIRQAIHRLVESGLTWTPEPHCLQHIFIQHEDEIRPIPQKGRRYLYQVVA